MPALDPITIVLEGGVRVFLPGRIDIAAVHQIDLQDPVYAGNRQLSWDSKGFASRGRVTEEVTSGGYDRER